MSWGSITKIAESVNSGKVKAIDNVELALSIIESKSEYQAIISTLDNNAKERANIIDNQVSKGINAGRLAGVPFIAKDNFLVFGSDTTAASNILRGFKAPYQSTAIEKLESEGAICVAKSNLDAFAHGSSTENSDFFVTKHPLDTARVPGGSSGGSAAAVMLDMVPFALGTDTGGSIRLPASFCGAVGYKPSYGLVSRHGVIAMASSTDVIGPITKNVEDAAIVLDVIAGKDPKDSTTIERSDTYIMPIKELKGIKIGVVKEYFGEGIDQEVKNSVQRAVDKLKNAGAEIFEVSLPSLPLALAVYYVICPAEVSSNLSRYDGLRFGYSAENSNNLSEHYENTREVGFGAEAKRRIMLGTYVLSSGYYDAYYKKAALVRTKLINEMNDALSEVDFLVGPTAPVTAFKIGENVEDPLKMYLMDIMTVAANLTGVPAISLPCGSVRGLPVGLQIMTLAGKDNELISLSKSVEKLVC